MKKFTDEQRKAISSRGRTIVSASAGSGKTSVMIEKLVEAVVNGADLDGVLAVTFTNKAAAQMKDRLRSGLIERLDGADEMTASRIKVQLSKIPTANISTIHAFCARLLRTYFYVLDIDAGFEIISADDSQAANLKECAISEVFDRRYAEGDDDFRLLLDCFVRKRSDKSLRRLVFDAHSRVRGVAEYAELLNGAERLYTEEGFKEVCRDFKDYADSEYARLLKSVKAFASDFKVRAGAEKYKKIFDEMCASLTDCMQCGLFDEKPPLCRTPRPAAKEEADKAAAESFSAFRTGLNKAYAAVREGISDESAEREAYFESGKIVRAFCGLLLQFDAEYAAIKREENKLDYNDLEHLTLKLLSDESMRREIASGYESVFVDEYQDVNPVQERIISTLSGASTFLVGDVKQAIYGFRGSKSVFFAEKFAKYSSGGGRALRLTANFRSSPAVIDFVNSVFSGIMTADISGFDYKNSSVMRACGDYPAGGGSVKIHIFGKEEKFAKERGVYSVKEDSRATKYTREGLAVLEIVRRELGSVRYDSGGGFVDVQPGDICVLTRKRQDGSALGIVKALTDAGYSVSGAQEANVCNRPEIRNMLDILSFLDDAEQDIPLVTAMLSPLGGFCEDELAAIRTAVNFPKDEKDASFRRCCKEYAKIGGTLARKLDDFGKKVKKLRDMCEVLDAGEMIDAILAETGWEAAYCAGGGEKLKNVLRLSEEGANLSVSAFLRKIKAGGYNVPAPASAASDSIKIMTMHSAKGLEFPVVIIADICKTFEGRDVSEMPFDERYLFSPKRYDRRKMLTRDTVLRKLCKRRQEREELINELNLFYVACTRAEYSLHIMASEAPAFSGVAGAKCYAKTFDITKYSPEYMPELTGVSAKNFAPPMIFKPDEAAVEEIERRFERRYEYFDSVDLPVKSSASAILRSDEEYYPAHELFGSTAEAAGETGAERGTAYHRFLELCDFAKKSPEEIETELEDFASRGLITENQRKLLETQKLRDILNMPAFSNLRGAELYREQEFLCFIKAKEILPTQAEDNVLVQGAIDLLAVGRGGVAIIDYKYSGGSDGYLREHYARQLALYKKAAARILKVREETVSATIINICLCRQIDM